MDANKEIMPIACWADEEKIIRPDLTKVIFKF